jgi:hypothetical protein
MPGRPRSSQKFALRSVSLFLLTAQVWFISPATAEGVVPNASGPHNPSFDAQPRQSRRSALREPRTTTDGVLPLGEPVSIRINDVLFRVPAAYISPWPQQRVRNRVNEWKALGIEFWIPDRRYLEISPLSNVEYRPREPGRRTPDSGAYIVRVLDLKPTTLDESGYISPERGFRNLTSIGSATISSFSFQDEPFGLVRFWQRDWPHPLPPPFIDYRHMNDTDPQALIRCTPPGRTEPTPSCSGTIHFAADDLGFFFSFPREALPHWHDIVLAVRDLYTSWKSSHP